MTIHETALTALIAWYDALPTPNAGLPAKGSVAVGLVLLDRLKNSYDLAITSHLAPGGAQIQGASGASVKRILAEYGENRTFVTEGGRTNRGIPTIATALLQALGPLKLDGVSADERSAILTELQQFLVGKVRDFHNRERIKPSYEPNQSSRAFIASILTLAQATGKRGPVAQYLVGAKLQLRFPDVLVRNELSSAADDQTGQPGDFVVGDTAFHVTVAPMQGHYDKCRRNLREGRRVYLLVPDEMVVGARQNAGLAAENQIAVESIESFVGQNVEELSVFSKSQLATELRRLLKIYNERVDAVESDKSLMIEIPHNLTTSNTA